MAPRESNGWKCSANRWSWATDQISAERPLETTSVLMWLTVTALSGISARVGSNPAAESRYSPLADVQVDYSLHCRLY